MNSNLSQSPSPDRLNHLLNDANSFDQVPIGGNTNKFVISEYAEGQFHQPVQTTVNLTMQQKLHSKTVKIKLQGLEDLKKALTNNQNSQQIQLDLSKILKQNNPACLEKALQCAQKWMQLGRSWGQRQIKQIIQNGCINGKGNTKKLASDLIFKAFQNRPQQIQRTVLELGLKAKVPKILGGYISVINQLLQQFGIKDLKYLKPYIPSVVQIMNNQKLPVIKTEGMSLLKNGLKWLGKDFLWPLFNDLKENMKKQLESFWQTHDKKQIMKANRQKNVSATNLPGNALGKQKKKNNQRFEIQAHSGGNENGLDIYQISDPVQIFNKFDEKWSETVLETQKWNAKTALLQEIITKASVAKISNSEHRHITEMIRRLLNDSNFNVVLSALKLIGVLAKGLRKNFNHSAKILFPYITPKFRDKKTQMIDQTSNTLNNLYYCLSIEQVGDDIRTGLKDKAAGMKNSIMKWMISYIEKKSLQNSSGSQKIVQFFKSNSIHNIFESLLNDPSADVRDSAARLVCKVRSIYGESLFKNIDKNISNKQILQKLNEGGESQQALAKSRGKDTSNKKTNLSKSKSKNIIQDNQQASTNSYTYKTNGKGNETVDITEQLNKNMKKLNDNSNWQNRKESAEKLIKYFSQLDKQNPNTKITSSLLYDFLGILKSRISDPNKQLIKIFVTLVGDVFRVLTEKQAKIQAKCFIQELIEVFSDKNQGNRKQIYKTFDRIAAGVGNQTMITYFGQIMTQQSNAPNSQLSSTTKQYTLQYLNNCQYFVNKVDQIENFNNLKQLKQYPKIILSGLCDKNKDLRAISQKIFKIFCQKTGTEIFRNFVNSKDQKSMFKNDLIAFLDKYEGLSPIQQPSIISNMSNGSFLSANNLRETDNQSKRSPSINKSKMNCVQQTGNSQKIKRKMSNMGSLNNSRSKNKNHSILGGQENNKDISSNSSFILKGDAFLSRRIEGNELFCNIQTLTNERIQREQMANRYRNNGNNHPITQQFQIQSSLSRLVNHQQLFIKMFSYDYTKNQQAANKYIKMCRDVAQTNSIRQISDLLIKWVIIKLYGGNVAAISLVDLMCPVLSVLEKKRVAWTDYDIDMLIYLSREYLFASFYDGNQNIQVLKNIFKLAITLSSGERIVKKILTELKSQVSHHRHLSMCKKEGIPSMKFYKRMLTLICGYLIDYFSNDGILGEAALIPELSQDVYFVTLLANKFHEGVLKQFGFRFQSFYSQSNLNDNIINLERSFYNAEKNPSLISPRNASPGLAFFGAKNNKNQSKDKKITPQKITQNPTITLNQSKFPPPSPLTKNRIVTQSTLQQTSTKKQPMINIIYRNIGVELNNTRYQIDLSGYNQPSHHNPLGSNLLRLFPYSQSTVHFFSTLFQPQNQSSDKIASQLSMNCNVIYGYLFNTLIKMMDLSVRQTQGPERVSTFTALVQHAIKCPNIYKNLSQAIIEKSIRYIIDQLVYQDQNRNNIQAKLRYRGFNDFKSDIFVKGINGVMLRILDNSYPLLLVNSLLLNLLQVLTDSKIVMEQNQNLHNINKGKKIGLIIRCFLRVSNSYFNQNQQKQKEAQVYNVEQDPNCLKTHHIHRFILLAKQYIEVMQISDLGEFQNREQRNLRNQKQSGNIVVQNNQQSVVYSICKIFRILHRKNLLIKNYEIIKKEKNHFKEERIISEFVSSIAGISFCQSSNLSGHHHQINYHLSSSVLIDEQLKKIIQMLSKSKTFIEGVKLLKLYVQQSGGRFDYKREFAKMSFQTAFIEKVNEEMGKLNILSSQGSSRSLNPDIQNKLERLKMKLEGINNQHSRSIAPKDMNMNMNEIEKVPTTKGNYINSGSNAQRVIQINVQRARDLSSKSIDQPQFSQQNDLKKRIQQMKNKVNMSTTNKLR